MKLNRRQIIVLNHVYSTIETTRIGNICIWNIEANVFKTSWDNMQNYDMGLITFTEMALKSELISDIIHGDNFNL
jgi:hypothetical protein